MIPKQKEKKKCTDCSNLEKYDRMLKYRKDYGDGIQGG